MDHTGIFETQGTARDFINTNSFRAFDCDAHSSDLSTARFSLNDPPACNSSDGSTYHPPEKRRAQVLQRMERIPVMVTSCQVKLRILVGYCDTIGSWNFIHSFFETHRALIRATKAQCHHSSPDGTLEISIPPYGNINRIKILMPKQ